MSLPHLQVSGPEYLPSVEWHVKLRIGKWKLTHKKEACGQEKLGELKSSVDMTPGEGAEREEVLPDTYLTLGVLSTQCEVAPKGQATTIKH